MNNNFRIVNIQVVSRPPQQESIISKGYNWFFGRTVKQLDAIYLVDAQNNKTDSGLTKQDIQNYCHQQGGFTSAKSNIINNFIDQLTGRKYVSESEKKCFCNWLLAVADVDIAKKITFDEDMALVRERDNDDLREFIEYTFQQHPDPEERSWMMDLITNSSKVFERKLSITEQKLLKELAASSSQPVAALLFLDRILSTKNSDEIAYNLQAWTPQLLTTFATLDSGFVKEFFSRKDAGDIIGSLAGWSPDLLETFATLDPEFLKKLFSTSNPHEVITHLMRLKHLDNLKILAALDTTFLDRIFSAKDPHSVIYILSSWDLEKLRAFARLDPAFLDRVFSAAASHVVISKLSSWNSEKLRAFTMLDPAFLDRVFSTKKPHVMINGLSNLDPEQLTAFTMLDPAFLDRVFSTKKPHVVINGLSNLDPEQLTAFTRLDSTFLDRVFSTKEPHLSIDRLSSWYPEQLRAFTRLDSVFLDRVFSTKEPHLLISTLSSWDPEQLTAFARLDPAFLDRVFSAADSHVVISRLRGWDPEQLTAFTMLDSTFLDRVFSTKGPHWLISKLGKWNREGLVTFAALNPAFLDRVFSPKEGENDTVDYFFQWQPEELKALANLNSKSLDRIFSSLQNLETLSLFHKSLGQSFIQLLKKGLFDEGNEELFAVWAAIDSHSDRTEIRKNLANNPSLAEQILDLNIEFQKIILFKVLTNEEGTIVFNFLKAQKLFEGNIPLDDLKDIILKGNLSEVIPALQLLTTYCGLPKDFNFAPVFDFLIHMKPRSSFSSPIDYDTILFQVIFRQIYFDLEKKDPTIPQLLLNKMDILLKSNDVGLEVMRDLSTTLAEIIEYKNKEPIHLNYSKLFNDPDINRWNNLQTRPSISDNEWSDLQETLHTFLMKLFPNEEDKNKCGNVLAFFRKSMESSDAKTDTGKKQIRQRVASIIDYLLSRHPEAPQLKDMIEMLDFGGGACPDRVMVTIDQAEMYIKFQLAGEKYRPNVLGLNFKYANIWRLVNPNQAENIETLLYYLITLNPVLQLGLPADTKMLYEGCAQKKPWTQVFTRLFLGFTPDDFISFVADNPFLQKQWKELPDYTGAMQLLTENREKAINAVNASDEEIGAYLKKEWGLEEDDFPTDEQIEIEKNNRQKELVGLKTFLLDKIAKVYEKAGFVMPRDTVNEEEARAAFIQKKKTDEAQNITKWNKQLIIVQALSKQLSNLIAVIPAEGIGKADFQMLVDKNKALKALMEQSQDADLGAFANRINLLLSKENESETIKKGDFTRTSMSLQMQEKSIKQSLQKSIQAYEDEINKLSEQLKDAKKMYESPEKSNSLTPEEEAFYYGKQQALSNAVQIGEQNFFKTQAQQLLLESGYLVSSEQ